MQSLVRKRRDPSFTSFSKDLSFELQQKRKII